MNPNVIVIPSMPELQNTKGIVAKLRSLYRNAITEAAQKVLMASNLLGAEEEAMWAVVREEALAVALLGLKNAGDSIVGTVVIHGPAGAFKDDVMTRSEVSIRAVSTVEDNMLAPVPTPVAAPDSPAPGLDRYTPGVN
jgi:hypothetical protein